MVLRALARLAAAAMTGSLGVANGLERYLCLKTAAPKIQVAGVIVDQNFQPSTNAFLQCLALVQCL